MQLLRRLGPGLPRLWPRLTRLGDCLPNAGKTRGLRTRKDFYSDLPSGIKSIGVFYAQAHLRGLNVESFLPNYGFYGPQQPIASSGEPSCINDLVMRFGTGVSDRRKTHASGNDS